MHNAADLPENQEQEFQKTGPVVLVGVDREPSARAVIEHAVRMARMWPNAELHVVHAISPLIMPAGVTDEFEMSLRVRQHDEAREYSSSMGDYAASLFAGTVRAHIVFASPADGILRAAERVEADMVVVGTHDYHGVRRFLLGSVAAEVSRRAHAPVLIVRPLTYPGSMAPAIEALCTDCASVRKMSAGTQMWCARHSEHHPRAHLHYEDAAGFGSGSQILRNPGA